MIDVLAVVGVALLVAVVIGVRHFGPSLALRSPIGWRLGDPPPLPAAPTDLDSRFALAPVSHVTVPLAAGGALLAVAAALVVAGVEVLAAFVALVGVLELGAAATAARSRRRAIEFLGERLLDDGSRSVRRKGDP